MNREIKFRGKRIDNGEWVYGSVVTTPLNTVIVSQVLVDDEIPQWVVHPETVGQYTGLKDGNGKEIYEGDILSNGQHIDWTVLHDEASFKVKHRGSITRDRWVLSREMAESREVIGNIYDNPELLGGESHG